MKISSLSIQQLEAYRLSVDNLKNAVHLSVVASHELVQKSQQVASPRFSTSLHRSLTHPPQLHEDMKQVEVVAAQMYASLADCEMMPRLAADAPRFSREMRKMMDTLDAMSLQYEKQRRRSAGTL